MASRINDDRLRVEIRGSRKRKLIDFSQGGPVLAGMEEAPFDVTAVTPQTFSWTVRDPQGGELAWIVREVGEPVNRLALEGGLDAATRTLTIAFAAALFDRWWLQIPKHPGGDG